jgi:hypothetical protein
MVVGVIVLAALGRMGQENRASALARLAAWNKGQVQRLERQAEREGRRLAGKARG